MTTRIRLAGVLVAVTCIGVAAQTPTLDKWKQIEAIAKAAIAELTTPASPVPLMYAAIADRAVRPKPALPVLGPAGFKFTDPTYSTPMLRVTDDKTMGAAVSLRTIGGGRYWNADSTKFILTTTGGAVVPFSFNAATMTTTKLPALSFQTAAEFSRSTASKLYGAWFRAGDEAIVQSYDFSTSAYALVAGVRDLVPTVDAGGRTYVRGVTVGGTSSDTVAFLFGGTSQDRDHYVAWLPASGARKVVDTQASTINGQPTKTPLGFLAHALGMDQAGRYVVIGPTQGAINAGAAPNVLWDTTTDIFTPMRVSIGGHGALGFGVSVNNPDDQDGMEWVLRDFVAANTVRQLVVPFPSPRDWSQSSHASWNNAQPTLVPVIAAMFRYGNNLAPWRAFDEEIVAMRTDGTSTVWRFAHHRSDTNIVGPETSDWFWYTPRPCVSPDGRWLLFTSNWEKTLGDDVGERNKRQDVFMLALPPS